MRESEMKFHSQWTSKRWLQLDTLQRLPFEESAHFSKVMVGTFTQMIIHCHLFSPLGHGLQSAGAANNLAPSISWYSKANSSTYPIHNYTSKPRCSISHQIKCGISLGYFSSNIPHTQQEQRRGSVSSFQCAYGLSVANFILFTRQPYLARL